MSEPIDLADVAEVLEGNPKAVLFRAVGPETPGAGRQRHRQPHAARARVRRRRRTSCWPRSSGGCATSRRSSRCRAREAPCQQVVLTGDDADLTRLPVHLAARRRRRALYLRLDRLRDRSQDRLDQCRPAPPDAARPPARPASTWSRRAICARSTRRAPPPASRCR